MSRSDFWPVAITLIVAGAVYFVGGRTSAYVCIALGAMIVLYLLLTKKSAPASVSMTANPEVTANPEMTANPNMSQNVHLYLPNSEKQEKPPLPPPKPKPKHNLRLHSCKMLQICENVALGGGISGFHSTDDQSKPNAAVVCVKNKSTEGEVASLADVRAALVFRDDKGKEIGHGVDQAVWLDNHLRNASFDLEETKCVIVAIVQRDYQEKITGIVAPYIRTHPAEYGRLVAIDAYELDADVSTVEVILLAKNSRVIEPMTFELFNENGKPGIRLIKEE